VTASMNSIWHDTDGLIGLIDQHLRWYPSMEPCDVYKLLYQGVLGPGHAVVDESTFRKRLLAEFDSLDAHQAGRLLERVRPDGLLLRINLRPFKSGKGDLESLIGACLSASGQQWGDVEELRSAWNTFCGLCSEGRWPGFGLASVSAFSVWLEAQGYPAVHHSPAYNSLYQPSYRLTAKTALSVLPSASLADSP